MSGFAQAVDLISQLAVSGYPGLYGSNLSSSNVALTSRSMRSSTSSSSALGDFLTRDILLSIFEKISIVHRKRLTLVCKSWKHLIEVTLTWVVEFSAVDSSRCRNVWEPASWLGLRFTRQRDFIRIPKAADVLARTAKELPNLRAISLECCDLNNRTMRTILNCCKKIEWLNLDSSIKLNHYSFILMVQDWSGLKHVNLSCCSEVNELSAEFLIQRLTRLESLSLCGTQINGHCLSQLNSKMKRLDISYCWNVRSDGLYALSRSPCKGLEELWVNCFDFDGSENCLVSLCKQFRALKHLQMSLGPCVAKDYFIDRIRSGGFSIIGQLSDLETLIIEKICVMDDKALLDIQRGCRKLKYLKLNLGWQNQCTDSSFSRLDEHLPNLEELHVLYPLALTNQSADAIGCLVKLKSLTLVNSKIDNAIFNQLEKLVNLRKLRLDECRKVTLRGFNKLCRVLKTRPHQNLEVSLIGTGILTAKLRTRKNLPSNLTGKISHFRSIKRVVQLPIL